MPDYHWTGTLTHWDVDYFWDEDDCTTKMNLRGTFSGVCIDNLTGSEDSIVDDRVWFIYPIQTLRECNYFEAECEHSSVRFYLHPNPKEKSMG